jgi:hypothetical protein
MSKFFGNESCGPRFEIGTSGIRNSNDDCLTSQHVDQLRIKQATHAELSVCLSRMVCGSRSIAALILNIGARDRGE